MNYKNCPNCNAKIGKSLMGKPNELVSQDFYQKLKDFLPDDFIKSGYCGKCVEDLETVYFEATNLYGRYHNYLIGNNVNIHLNEKKVLEGTLKNREQCFEAEKKKLVEAFSKDIVIYSNTPKDIDLVGYVESFQVVNSGMWSTASDNFNPLISVVHDQLASAGSKSDELLTKGFEDSKKYIRYNTCLKKCNTIVDFKHSFSELAGNGKILIYSQGTAGIDKNRPVISFTAIEESNKKKTESIKTQIKEIEDYFASRTLTDLKALIESELKAV